VVIIIIMIITMITTIMINNRYAFQLTMS